MAITRLRLDKQLEAAGSAGALIKSNSSNEAEWLEFTSGSDQLVFYDDSASAFVPLSLGSNISITGTTLNASAGAGGYATIQEEGSDLAAQTKLNFIGAGITAADDGGNSRTNVTLDATLNALAAYNTNGLLTQTAADTFTGRTLQGTTNRITVTNGDGVSGNPAVDISASYVGQATITTLGTIGTGTWQGTVIEEPYGGTGISTYTKGDILVATATDTLGKLNVGSAGFVLRVGASDTLEWASAADLIGAPLQSVKVKSTGANLTLSGEQTIDGVLTSSSRILVNDQTAPAQNGIYVTASGAWSRAADADEWDEYVSASVWVEEGTTYGDTKWYCGADAGGTLGTTAINFVQTDGASQITAGTGLTKTGNTINVETASASRIVVNADNIDLATTGVSASTYGSATQVPVITLDAYGRATSASNTAIAITSSAVSDFTEAAQDAVGAAVAGSNILTYDDGANTLEVTTQMSITSDASGLKLSGDSASPGNSKYYGTNGSGTKGYFDLPTPSPSIVYIEGSTASSVDMSVSGNVKDRDGANTTFSVPTNTEEVHVFLNGQRLNQTGTLTTRDYSFSTDTITFTFNLKATDVVTIYKLV
jgi:hypothetical protein